MKSCKSNYLSYSNNIGNKLEDFEILQIIAEGSYGSIAKVKSKLNSEIYALKKIKIGNLDEKEKFYIKKELIFFEKLNHPNIFKYLGHFEENGCDYYISKFFDKDNLFKFLEDKAILNIKIEEYILWQIFLQCLEGLKYLHNQGVIHRDIKPGNIFIDGQNNIQIGNFDCAAVMEENQAKYFTDDPQMQKALILNQDEKIGTENYIAPEIENSQHYDQKADVYSLGVSFYALCYYNLPFLNGKNMNELMADTLYSYELKKNIRMMIQKDQNTRPKADEIYAQFKNDFIKKYGITSI